MAVNSTDRQRWVTGVCAIDSLGYPDTETKGDTREKYFAFNSE